MQSRSLRRFAAFLLIATVACESTALAQGYGQPQQPYPPGGAQPPWTTPAQPYPPQPYPPQQYPPQQYPPQQYPPQQYPPQPYPPQQYPPQQYPPYGYTQPVNTRTRSDVEMGVLYGTSAAYGVGVGIWLDTEMKLDDPALKFIFPVVLGVGAPVGAYFLDQPKMDRGLPAAVSAGMFLGAGEGLGIWSYQYCSTDSSNEWGFRGLARSMTLGSTLGAVGGFAAGYYLEPSPKSAALVSSSALWGGLIGSMVGYGASGDKENSSFSSNNDGASLGGLVGYNLGMGAAAGLSAVYTPSWMNLAWMWIGGGIGAAVGLPVYLAYLGSDKPAQRGLIFQGLTTGLGIAAGGIFSSGLKDDDYITVGKVGSFAQVTGFGFMPVQGGGGLQVGGILF